MSTPDSIARAVWFCQRASVAWRRAVRFAWRMSFALLSLALGLGMIGARAQAGDHTATAVGHDQLYRLQVHFSPARNWMNDPNGLVYFNGLYHLFFQYNPYGSRWGHMSWGHAVSRDLLHWQQLRVAIPESRRFMIFSGSAVVDWHDTTGFGVGGRPPLVAIYTAQPRIGIGPQTQNLAYSTDGGMTWRKYGANPVLDIGLRDFRDPKVFWYAPQGKWVMAVSRAAARKISFYSSPNLKVWTHTGDFGPAGDTSGGWECPDLFELPVEDRPGETRWVLKVDVQRSHPGTGGGGQVFIGRFNGKTFEASSMRAQPVDLGEDYYASASWSDLPGDQIRHVTLGWMDNWLYAQNAPTSPWRGAMALPRRATLRFQDGAYRLMQQPIAELATLRYDHQRFADFAAPNGRTLLSVPAEGGAHEIRTLVRVGRQGAFAFVIGSTGGRFVRIKYDGVTGRFSVSREGTYRFSQAFDSRDVSALSSGKGAIVLDMIIDRSSVEAYANDGEVTVSERMFPAGGAYTVRMRSSGARIERMDIWSLHSIW